MIALLLLAAVQATELEATYQALVGPGEQQVLELKSLSFPAALLVECTVGERELSWEVESVAPGVAKRFPLPRDEAVTSASCQALARFADGQTEGVDIDLVWAYQARKTQGDPSEAQVDLLARQAILPVGFRAERALLEAMDRDGALLFQQELSVHTSSGRATVRWNQEGASAAATLRFTLYGADDQEAAFLVNTAGR